MKISLETFKFFADLIYTWSGIHYPEKDSYRLESRLDSLSAHMGLENAEQLKELYQTNITPEMKTTLMDLCTNNETYFFRDTKPFQAFIDGVAKPFFEDNASAMLKVWSAASSTGQEALSILMSLKEHLAHIPLTRVSLNASDISTRALEKAKSGIYTGLEVQRGLEVQMLMKYFEPHDNNHWKVKSELLNKIKYNEFNLLTGQYPVNEYDVIFCRNVLIYQTFENKELILSKMFEALRPGGVIILGAGESLVGSQLPFEHKQIGNNLFFEKPSEIKKVA